MNYWFTSDTHYGHFNIIEYTKRPFKSLEQMNSTLIRNHNNRVKKDDVVFMLGDFCFRNTVNGKPGEGSINRAEHYIQQLNGRFVFVKGNHDNNNSLKTIINGMEIEIGGYEIYCVHNPADYHAGYKINFVGHVHELWKIKRYKGRDLINVGVDVWNFMPVNINHIMGEYSKFLKLAGDKKDFIWDGRK